MEIFADAADIKLFHIPYQGGGPAVAALLGGQIDALASGPSAAIGQIKAGKMRALAVWGDKRLASLPDVPSMKELGYDATFYIWSGLFAPAATPHPILTTLRDAVKRTVEDPEFKEAMAKVETPIAYLDAPRVQDLPRQGRRPPQGRGRTHRQGAGGEVLSNAQPWQQDIAFGNVRERRRRLSLEHTAGAGARSRPGSAYRARPSGSKRVQPVLR